MRYPITNPFVGTDDYHCFACAPHHPTGLQLRFERHGDEVHARWQPSRMHQGYSAVVHGGIQATLLDEVSSWAIFVLCGVAAVTQRISVEYEQALPLNAGEVVAIGAIAERTARLITVESRLCIGPTQYTHATARFRVLPELVARRTFGFPDPQRFHDQAHATSSADSSVAARREQNPAEE